jgi:pyridoxal phosphate enzyme (YggS family)
MRDPAAARPSLGTAGETALAMTEPRDVQELRIARAHVVDRIADAAARAGRDPASVTLVAVSKTVPPERVVAAVAAGLTILGENRVQEGESKVGLVRGATWHLVGPLQSNKARRALEVFDVIESVDSVDLARRLDRIAGEVRPGSPVPILLQVNVDDDDTKAGFTQAAVAAGLDEILGLPNIDPQGLMTIGRLADTPAEARSTFRALRELSERLRADRPGLGGELSMGMSADFDVAVEEGATIVRVGSALFGARPHIFGENADGRPLAGDAGDASGSRW